jgi:hypothetical protein
MGYMAENHKGRIRYLILLCGVATCPLTAYQWQYVLLSISPCDLDTDPFFAQI